MGALERKPGGPDNWLERVGGLDPYLERVAKSIHEKRGLPISQAIRIAWGVLRNWKDGRGDVDADTRAKAAAAVANMERKRAQYHAQKAARTDLSGHVDVRDIVDLAAPGIVDTYGLTAAMAEAFGEIIDLAPGDYRRPYDWKHGYIPLTPAAALSKAKKGPHAGKGRAKPPRSMAEKARRVKKAADDAKRGRAVPGELEAARKDAAEPDYGAMSAEQAATVRAKRAGRGVGDRVETRNGPATVKSVSTRGTTVEYDSPDLPNRNIMAGTPDHAAIRPLKDTDRRPTDARGRVDSILPNRSDETATDRRAQERAVERKDYANADGPALAAEAARRGLVGRERAMQKSDAQLRAMLRNDDKAPAATPVSSLAEKRAAKNNATPVPGDQGSTAMSGKSRAPYDTTPSKLDDRTLRNISDNTLDTNIARYEAALTRARKTSPGVAESPTLRAMKAEKARREAGEDNVTDATRKRRKAAEDSEANGRYQKGQRERRDNTAPGDLTDTQLDTAIAQNQAGTPRQMALKAEQDRRAGRTPEQLRARDERVTRERKASDDAAKTRRAEQQARDAATRKPAEDEFREKVAAGGFDIQRRPWSKIPADYKSGKGTDRKVMVPGPGGSTMVPYKGPEKPPKADGPGASAAEARDRGVSAGAAKSTPEEVSRWNQGIGRTAEARDRLKADGYLDDGGKVTPKGARAGVTGPTTDQGARDAVPAASAAKTDAWGRSEGREEGGDPKGMSQSELLTQRRRLDAYIAGRAGGTATDVDVERWRKRRQAIDAEINARPGRETQARSRDALREAREAREAATAGTAGKITPETARRMSDEQLERAMERLVGDGTFSGPSYSTLEKELDRRDAARAEGNARRR